VARGGWKGSERRASSLPRRRLLLAAFGCVALAAAVASPGARAARPDVARGVVAQLNDSIATLASQADRLDDVNAVKKLQRAFGYYIDKGYWGEAASLFADNATLEVGVDGVYVGRARIRKRLMLDGGGNPGPGLPYGQIYHRMQLQPVIDISADGNTAWGRWREIALLGHFHHDAEWGTGVYEDEYVKQDGVWKIRRMHYFPNFVAPYDSGWAKLPRVTGDWKSAVGKAFPADRPPTIRYEPFPSVFTPPFHYRNPAAGGSAAEKAAAREVARVETAARKAASAESRALAGRSAAQARELGALEALLAHCAHELARLQSREQIERLQAAYGYYIDKGRWNQAAALFSRRATYEYGQQGIYVGRAHIRKALGLMGPRGLRTGQLNDYPMLQPIISVSPDNRTATARWRSDVMMAKGGKGEWGGGVYNNEYVNDHGVWKIAKLHFYVTFFASYAKGWAAGDLPLEGPSAKVPPDRPPSSIYRSLPGVYVPPYPYSNPVTGTAPFVAHDVEGPVGLPANVLAAQASVDALAHKIMLLRDHAAIDNMQRAYGYYVDKAQWPQIAALFAADGTYEIGGRGIFIGPKRVLQYLVTGLGPIGMATRTGQLLNHQQFQGIVDVSPDGKTAKGRWTALILGGTASRLAIWGDALYENSYVKDHGVWKFQHVRAAFNMYAPYKGGWRNGAVPNTRPDSFPPPPDLPPSHVYLTYPSFYVLPFHYLNPVTGKPAPPLNPAAGGTAPMSRYARKGPEGGP
jgi:SnoaL-like domain